MPDPTAPPAPAAPLFDRLEAAFRGATARRLVSGALVIAFLAVLLAYNRFAPEPDTGAAVHAQAG